MPHARSSIAPTPVSPSACRSCPSVGWTAFREHRLWRNRADVRFHNHIHETVVPAIQRAAESDRLGIDPFDGITVVHPGDDGNPADERARDEPLLLAELARDPDRPFVYDHLARVYAASGDGRARRWRRGSGDRGGAARDARTLTTVFSTSTSSITCWLVP